MDSNNNPPAAAAYRMMRSMSNSNPSLDVQVPAPMLLPSNDVHVEYEVSVPVVPSFRHTPYHSLWNLNQR